MRLLLVEDDFMLGDGIAEALRNEGYTVDWVKDGQSALAALKSESFDLVVLDLGLPKLDGVQLIKQARAASLSVPILVLTARDTVQDRVTGLDAGADDYLVKPFDAVELKARIRALIRRSAGRATPTLQHADIVLDPSSQTVAYKGEQVILPRREYVLLKELLEHSGQVLSRERLTQTLYGWLDDVESNALEVHVHHLRKKFFPELIKTVRGVGYIIEKPKG
ncbi:MAG TPA: response regulator [Pseudomonadales bacterium]|nr:response regulator [Pseudomonadales bacterium]